MRAHCHFLCPGAKMKKENSFTETAQVAQRASIRSASDTRVIYGKMAQTYAEGELEEEDAEEEEVRPTHPIPHRIGDYEIKGTIGEGSFSIVKLAYLAKEKKYLACKVIEKCKIKKKDLQKRFEAEIRVHQQMRHPGVVELYDLLHDDYFYYVILEFCPGGELFQFIVDQTRVTEEASKPILAQLLLGLRYIHKANVAHRDLKPENLLLDQSGKVKISDFGLSRFLDSQGLVATPCGSPCYASPECISGYPYNGTKSDMWSLGVIFYAMVTGQLPWTKRNQTQLFEQIRRGEYTVPTWLSPDCKSLIKGLMCVDADARLSAAQALQHPFLAGFERPITEQLAKEMPVVSLRKVDEFFGDDVDLSTTENIELGRTLSQRSMMFNQVQRYCESGKRTATKGKKAPISASLTRKSSYPVKG